MSKKTVTVGLIGYQFMGKAHSNAYRQVGRYFDLPVNVRMKTICGRTESAVKVAADTFGWEGYETDWRKVVEDPEIDVIDVVTPGSSHCEIVVAAAEAGKAVFCEKPIGNTLAEAERMVDAVRRAGVPHAVNHNYRKAPAIALAKRMIEDGRIGTVFHMRAVYLQDWISDPSFPLVWRLQKNIAGSGTLGDLNSHLIDIGRYLVGEFDEVAGHMHTFVKERPLVGEVDDKLGATASQESGEVTVDDVSMFLAKFKCGARGTFESTRFAVGRKNCMSWEINGSKGALAFSLERMNELEFYDDGDPSDSRGFRLIQATEAEHPYAGHYWPVGHVIGYEQTFINLLADALTAMSEGREISPSLEDGYQNQRVMDAVEKSHESRGWVQL